MSSRSQHTEGVTREQERAERAARVAAMLARWAQQDVASEPSWDIEDVERLRLTRMDAETDAASEQ